MEPSTDWGRGLDGVRGLPIMPPTLSTIRCGKRVERWKERRAILIRQRDLQERRLVLGLAFSRAKTEESLERKNALIEDCNKAIDLINAVEVVAAAHPEEQHKLLTKDIAKKVRRKT